MTSVQNAIYTKKKKALFFFPFSSSSPPPPPRVIIQEKKTNKQDRIGLCTITQTNKQTKKGGMKFFIKAALKGSGRLAVYTLRSTKRLWTILSTDPSSPKWVLRRLSTQKNGLFFFGGKNKAFGPLLWTDVTRRITVFLQKLENMCGFYSVAWLRSTRCTRSCTKRYTVTRGLCMSSQTSFVVNFFWTFFI